MGTKCFMVEEVGGPEGHRERELPEGGKSEWQVWHRIDTGEIFERFTDLPVGAMYFADTFVKRDTSPKLFGRDWDNCLTPPLIVKTPGGWWNIDSRASNCTLPDDKNHRCWIRHGEAPMITVDKAGVTCQAGAGSIQCGSYHGFLRNGELTD